MVTCDLQACDPQLIQVFFAGTPVPLVGLCLGLRAVPVERYEELFESAFLEHQSLLEKGVGHLYHASTLMVKVSFRDLQRRGGFELLFWRAWGQSPRKA